MKPLPAKLWALLSRRVEEFEAENCSGSLTVELHFERGRLASWKLIPVLSDHVDVEKPLTGARGRA